jgi:hypothetical protein
VEGGVEAVVGALGRLPLNRTIRPPYRDVTIVVGILLGAVVLPIMKCMANIWIYSKEMVIRIASLLAFVAGLTRGARPWNALGIAEFLHV